MHLWRKKYGGNNAAKNVDRYVTKDMSKYEQRNSTW